MVKTFYCPSSGPHQLTPKMLHDKHAVKLLATTVSEVIFKRTKDPNKALDAYAKFSNAVDNNQIWDGQ